MNESRDYWLEQAERAFLQGQPLNEFVTHCHPDNRPLALLAYASVQKKFQVLLDDLYHRTDIAHREFLDWFGDNQPEEPPVSITADEWARMAFEAGWKAALKTIGGLNK